jgi:hypothetical protein
MTAQAIIWLGELLREYMESPQEFEELSEVYGVEIPSWHGRDPWTMFARFLMENLEHGTTRLFLEGVLEQVEVRNSRGIAGSRFERLQHHQLLEGHLARLKDNCRVAASGRCAAFELTFRPSRLVLGTSRAA